MANPLDTLKKLRGRSLSEVRARGEREFSVSSEPIGAGGKLPSDAEFAGLLDKSKLDETGLTPAGLLAKFFEQGRGGFFQSFAGREKTVEVFRRQFGADITASVIERAERILEGRFDLLGFRDLEFGAPVNWHFDPLSENQAPGERGKPWQALSGEEADGEKIIRELNRHQHFFTLGFAYWLTQDEIYAEAFAEQLDDWMEQNPLGVAVNWANSREVGRRAISWIWTFHFFENSPRLTPELFHKALKFLYLHARHIEKHFSTQRDAGTDSTGAALALYYLGTQLSFLIRAENWRRLGEEILSGELERQISDDGVQLKSSTRQARCTADFYTHFLILRKLSGAPPDGLQEKLSVELQKLLDFLMHATRPDGTTPLLGNGDDGRSLPLSEAAPSDFRYTLASGAALFRRSDYKFVAKNIAEETVWLLGAEGVEAFENLAARRPVQNSKDFPRAGCFVMRDGWAETDNFLLVDCGKASDARANRLAIDAALAGKTLLVNSGTYVCGGAEESRNYSSSTLAPNTLTVDEEHHSAPGGKAGWRTETESVLKSWIADDRFDFFEAARDVSQGRSPAAHTRSVLFLKNDYVIMRDFVETGGAGEYESNFRFHPQNQPEILETPDSPACIGVKSGRGVGARFFIFGDGGGWQNKKDWFSDYYGKRREAPHLQFAAGGVGAQEFFTFLFPTDALSAAPEVAEAEIVGGRAFVVNFRDYQDVFVFSDGGQIVRTELFAADFRFVWARLSDGEPQPEEFVLIDGTNFIFDGRETINRPARLKFLTARRLGNRLNVRTNETIFSLSLSPEHG